MDAYFNDFVSDFDHAFTIDLDPLCDSAWLDDDDLVMLDDLASLGF